MAGGALLGEWTGRDVSVAAIERQLIELRESSRMGSGSSLRTNVMTHLAWVPPEWREAALEALEGLAERHPSRSILLTPDLETGRDALDADVTLRCFPVAGEASANVCSEVIELMLRGRLAAAPATIVEPLLVADLTVFLRWRGELPFGSTQLEQLVGVTDRLVIDSREWGDESVWQGLTGLFDRVAVSDIGWSRTSEWRGRLAELWPGIVEAAELRVEGPRPEALLLRGWLESRLGRPFELVHEPAPDVEAVAVDGRPVEPPRADRPTASDLLSAELELFGRDPIYEAAVETVVARGQTPPQFARRRRPT